MKNTDLAEFLDRNNISQETWDASGSDWQQLVEIGSDHQANQAALLHSADFFAKLIQAFPSVHSVRWRVKEADHLLEKIIRKRASRAEKYQNINVDNYYKIVTDLVGIRALHLFKDDCFSIDSSLRSIWQPMEQPVAYTRTGDDEDFLGQLREQGFEIKSHPAGYRSVHYVFESQPLARKVIMEVQVRTIFEEGWSEIDHKVRYPNFSDNQLVSYFLTIFNRMAGSADEMGGFVRGLVTVIEQFESQVATATAEKERTLTAMEGALAELANVKRQDQESKNNIAKLKDEIENLKRQAAAENSADPWKVAADVIAKLAVEQRKKKDDKLPGYVFFSAKESKNS